MSAPHAETQAPASEGAVTTDDEGGATLVGYGAKAASSKRRLRKGAPAPGGTAAGSAAEAPARSRVRRLRGAVGCGSATGRGGADRLGE